MVELYTVYTVLATNFHASEPLHPMDPLTVVVLHSDQLGRLLQNVPTVCKSDARPIMGFTGRGRIRRVRAQVSQAADLHLAKAPRKTSGLACAQWSKLAQTPISRDRRVRGLQAVLFPCTWLFMARDARVRVPNG